MNASLKLRVSPWKSIRLSYPSVTLKDIDFVIVLPSEVTSTSPKKLVSLIDPKGIFLMMFSVLSTERLDLMKMLSKAGMLTSTSASNGVPRE